MGASVMQQSDGNARIGSVRAVRWHCLADICIDVMETPCQCSLKEYLSAPGVRFKDAFHGNLKRSVSIDATQFISAFIAVRVQIFTDELKILQILSGDAHRVRDDGVLGFAQSNRVDEPICARLFRNGLYMLAGSLTRPSYQGFL